MPAILQRTARPCRVTPRALVSLCVGAMAAAGPNPAVASQTQINAVAAPDAVAVYEARSAAEPDNPEWRFRLGMALAERGRTRDAIRQFRRILVDHPEAVRVRLELARAYYVVHDWGNAERQFRLAGAANLPAVVAANVDRYLKSIRAERSWSLSASFAIAPDTNINAATAAETIEVYGLPFSLADGARRSSGVGLSGQVGAEWAPRVAAAVRQRFGMSLSRREYQGDTFDDMVLSGYTGPRASLGRVTLAAAATASRRWYGGRPYSRTLGGQAELAYYPGARTALSVQASASDLRHVAAAHLNGSLLALTVGATRALDKQSMGNLRVGVSRHNAANPAFAQTALSLAAIYARDLPAGFSVSLQPSVTRSRFDGLFVAFGRARRDTNYSVQLTMLNRKLTVGRFAPRIGVTQTVNHSNIALYAFRRTRFDLGVTTIF